MLSRIAIAVLACAGLAWAGIGLRAATLQDEAQTIAKQRPAQLTAAERRHALDLYRRAGQLNPDTSPELFAAGLDIRIGEPQRATRLLRKVVEQEPKNVQAWSLLAVALRHSDPVGSSAALLRARQLAPPPRS